MASGLLSLAGWYFLPNLATGYLQTILYSIFIRAGDPKPAPGSPRYIKDRRRLHILVIVAYLAYTVYEADYTLRREGDFYTALGVGHDVDDKGLLSRFRRLTVLYHPDKLPASTTPTARALQEAHYIHLQLARDTLVDPAKRFAYDRFGPEVLTWRHCKTLRDFVFRGLQQTTTYYVVSLAVLVLIGVLGYLQQGKYWRFLAMGALFVVELHIITRPTVPAIMTRFVNPVLLGTGWRQPYLPFQMIALLRKLILTFFIALSQLGPLLQDQQPQAGVADGDTVTPQQLDRLDALARATDQEVSRLMGMELSPFAGEGPNGINQLKEGLKEWLVYNSVRSDPEVRGAVEGVFRRRQQEGAAASPG